MDTRPDRRHITLKAASYFKRQDFTVYPSKTVSELSEDNLSTTEQVSKQYFVYDAGTSKITIELKHNLSTRLTHVSISGEARKAGSELPYSEKSDSGYALRNEKDLNSFAQEIHRYFALFPDRKAVDHWMEGLINWYLPDYRPYKPAPDAEVEAA